MDEIDNFDLMQEERLWPTVEDDAEYLEPEEDLDYPPENYDTPEGDDAALESAYGPEYDGPEE